MPAGYMDAWLQVGKNYGDAIKTAGSAVAGGIQQYRQDNLEKGDLQESLKSKYNMYEQTAKASGQPIDPTITERYKNIGGMSLNQLRSLNKDMSGYNEMNMNLFGLQRQQQAYQMQQQAMQRAAQAQDLSTRRSNIINVLGGASNYQPAMPQGTGQLPTINPLFPTY